MAGYNLGLLVVGTNNVPANVKTTIEATNTTQGQQTTQQTPPTRSVTTVITDPDGTPGTGDETATDASFNVELQQPDLDRRSQRHDRLPTAVNATAPPTGANNTLLINALVGGFLNVQFRCAPGTVTAPDPGRSP